MVLSASSAIAMSKVCDLNWFLPILLLEKVLSPVGIDYLAGVSD